jgi:hypothetical protein
VTRAAREVLPDDDDPQTAVVAVGHPQRRRQGDDDPAPLPELVDKKGNVRPAKVGYERDDFNLATNAKRSTGSTIKPVHARGGPREGLSLQHRRRAPACDTIRDRFAKDGIYRYCNAAGEGGGSRGSISAAPRPAGVGQHGLRPAGHRGRTRADQGGDAEVGRRRPHEETFYTNISSFGLGPSAQRHAAVDGQTRSAR